MGRLERRVGGRKRGRGGPSSPLPLPGGHSHPSGLWGRDPLPECSMRGQSLDNLNRSPRLLPVETVFVERGLLHPPSSPSRSPGWFERIRELCHQLH